MQFNERNLINAISEMARSKVRQVIQDVVLEMGEDGAQIAFDEDDIRFDPATSQVHFPQIEFPSEEVHDRFLQLVRERFGNAELTVPSQIGGSMTPAEKQAQFLLHLAEKSEWNVGWIFPSRELGAELGFSEGESDRICIALERSGYVTMTMDPSVFITNRGMDKAETMKVAQDQAIALRVLKTAARIATPELGFSSVDTIRKELKITDTQKAGALRYLEDKRFIRIVNDAATDIEVTAVGREQLGESFGQSRPDVPSPQNVLNNYGTISHSQVGQAGGSVHQTGSFTLGPNLKELAEFLTIAQAEMPKIAELTSEQREEAEHHIQAAQQQLTREKPNAGIVKTSLWSLKTILEQVAANAIATVLLAKYKLLLASMGLPVA